MKRMMILFAVAAAMAAVPLAQAQDLAKASAVSLQTVGFAGAGAQVKDDLFAGTEKFATGATDVTEINLDPKMLGMVSGNGDVSGLARKMKFIVIHTYTYDKVGMYRAEDVDTYRKKLEDGTWSCAIHVRDKNGTTDICTRSSPDHEGNEMVILAAEPKELTFIHMSGDMSVDDLSKMGGSVGGLKKH